MCGYVFFSGNQNKITKENINSILNLQKHRGPDYSNFVKYKNCFFLHNRLKIIDLSSNANQPFEDNNGNLIIFNGEIYNYLELKKKFNLKNFKSNSDTEVILKLYNLKGPKFIELLNGIFSFVIFNKKKNKVLVARDRFGIKPLFYYKKKNFLIYSTEIKPILRIIKKSEINSNEIKRYIGEGKYFDTSKTFFKDIKIFPPASFKEFSLKNFNKNKIKKYWKLKKIEKLKCKNEDHFFKSFIKHTSNAVKLNLVSDAKYSLLLSSGTDSNFIKSIIEDCLNKKISSFTYGWKNRYYNEILRLKELKLKNYSKIKKYVKDPEKIFYELKKLVYLYEGPLGGFGTAAQYYLMKKIKKNKIKVALSGEGTDEFLLGYKNLQKIFLNNDKSYLTDQIFTPDGKEMIDKKLILKNSNFNYKKTKFRNINDVVINYTFKIKLPKLLYFYDKSSALNGIEGRVPMLDHKYVEFIFSNSDKFKIDSNGSKKPIRKWFVRNNKKIYNNKLEVSTPQREFFKQKKIFNYVIKLVENGELIKCKILNFKEFKLQYLRYIKENKVSNSFFIWKVLNAEFFLLNYRNKII